jgi:prolipoprotein diacylglyceryl transferase
MPAGEEVQYIPMIFNYIHWNVDPEIFRFGNFAVRWYGLLFASGFYFGYLLMTRIFREEKKPIALLDKLAIYTIVATIVGARLGHCLFYEPAYYLQHPLKILKVWEGGLASHGAAIGIIGALWWFTRKYKLSILWVLDRIVITVALAGFLIRTGNLMNSEIYGIETSLPWGFLFLRNHEAVPKHPTQLYEGLSYLLIFFYLLYAYWKQNKGKQEGFLFGMFLILVFAIRFVIEFIKEPQVDFETTMALNMGQLLSIPFIILGLIMVFRRKKA